MAAPQISLARKFDIATQTLDELWDTLKALQEENDQWHRAAKELDADSPVELALFANKYNETQ